MAISQTERDQVLKIVAGLFNGAPGGAILNDLSQAVEAGVSMAQLADILANTNQFKNDVMGGKTTTADQVGVLLENFGLTPDDEAGSPATMAAEFFTARIEGGAGFGAIVLEAVTFLDNTTNEAFAPYSALLNNKALVASVHADNYATIAGVAGAQALFEGVTSEFPASEEDALQHVKDIVDADEPGEPGETFTLTSGTDIIEGTERDDIIEGVASSLSSARTLDAGDQIDGGEGTDTLNVDMQGNFTGFSGDGFLKNVENVNLTNSGTIARSFAARQVEGVEAYNLTGAVNLSDLGSTDAAVNLIDRASGATTIAYATGVTSGTADALALGLSNVGTAEVKDEAGTVTTPEATVTVTANGIEEVNITATGANVVGLGSNDAKALTAAGEGSLKLNAIGTGVKTINASGLTGALDVNLADATGVTSVAGGAGDDIIRAGAGDLAINAEINGGAGDDTLALTGVLGTVQYQMSDVETVEIDGVTTTFSATNASGVENLVVKGAGNDATFANMGAADLNVTLNGDAAGTVVSDHSGSTTLNVTGGTEATPTTAAAATTFNKTSSVDLTVDQYNTLTGGITAAAAQSFTADLAGEYNTGAISLAAATSAVFTDTNADTDNIVNLQADKLTDLVVTNAGGFALTGSSLAGLEALTVNSAKHFDATGINLAKVANVELSGAGSDAQVTLGNLGAADVDYNIAVSAEGLAAGLVIGTIDTDKGQAINVNVAGVLGDVDIGNVTVADDGADKTGTITIDANGTAGNIELGALNAKTVTVDASGALGTVGGAGTTVEIDAETATFTGSALGANNVSVTASNSGAVSGGIADDVIEVAGGGVGTKAAFTVTTGLGDDVIEIGATAGALRVTITDFSVGDDNVATASFTGTNFAVGGGATGIAAFLTSALGTAVADTAVTEAYLNSFVDGIFVFNNTVHAVEESGDLTYGDGDVFITFTGVTAADVGGATDLIA
ncbi:beta strand repeat-containing protein [Nitrosomonas halophila]|uniref:S-layer protein n=1 Tax=Nitrosomonas halophila TaxID=44576 RepID=A0A1H3IAN9_9PROT|nr:hypothetical protein [Nitrosomonas halophila]SDY24770.1 hypothetical protein SAMN05421881_102526 [Nitrosomonas halophila]